MSKQTEALRLADKLLAYELSEDYVDATKDAATELRRLHEVNQELLEALEWIVRVNATDYEYQQKARSAITKATGESE